jgi:hypothetical protein
MEGQMTMAATPSLQAGGVPGLVTLVTLVTVPLPLASTALYGKRTGLGIRASLGSRR